MSCVSISTSSVQCRRMGKRVRHSPQWKIDKLSQGPWWKKDPIVMTSPLARTQHPTSAFTKIEEDLSASIAEQSIQDSPVEMDDPYAPPPSRCILCPDKYEPGHAPTPSCCPSSPRPTQARCTRSTSLVSAPRCRASWRPRSTDPSQLVSCHPESRVQITSRIINYVMQPDLSCQILIRSNY